jgi:hypothetical protein
VDRNVVALRRRHTPGKVALAMLQARVAKIKRAKR